MSSGEPRVKNFLDTALAALFTWEFLILQILALALVAVMLETPTGSIAGTIALEKKQFGVYSYNLKENKVYALVNGPRNGPQVERGVWVNDDGSFRIDQLPVGEYMLEVRAPGFARELVRGLYIEDGKVAKLPKPVKLSLLSPSVNIASNSRVFTTKDKPNFWVNATGAAEAEVKVYKGDLLALLDAKTSQKWGISLASDMSLYVDSSKNFENPFESASSGTRTEPVKVFKRKLVQDQSDSSHAEFAFDETLPPGDYFTVCEVKDLFGKEGAKAITWFSVSDIGLVIKHAPGEAVVRAVDLTSLKGASGVNVALFERVEGTSPQARVKAGTGADGIAHLPLTEELRKKLGFDVIVTGVKGAHRAYGGYNYWRADSDLHKTYFYTDRPVYRLGQTVMFKGIARLMGENGLSNAGAGQNLAITVEDPDNNAIQTLNLKTSKHGTFSGLIDIPADGKTGGYQVQIAYGDGHTSYQSFEVAQYRKPEYQVEVEPLSDRVIMGEKGRAKVRATYYFGGPVAGARVKYSIYSSTDWASRYKLMDRPEYCGFFDDWEGSDYESSSGDFLKEGFAVTDENGEAIVEFETTAPTMPASGPIGSIFQDKKLKIEAEVTDISRLSVVSSGNVPESSGNFVLLVNPDSWVVRAGEALSVNIRALTYDSKAVANKPVKVKVMRFPYDRIKEEYKPDQVVVEQTVTTDSAGRAHLQAAIGNQLPSDSYYVVAEAQDDGNHKVVDTTSIWVAAGEKPFFFSEKEADKQPLTVKLDKKVYKAGDKARLVISGPFTGKEGMEALVGVEGYKLHELKVVPLTSSAQVVEVDIKPNYAPNFYVTVSVVGKKRQFYSQEEPVMVSPDNHFLKLSIETDKERYKPGDDAVYTIRALTADGKPAAGAEVSLGVVDESIYAIRPETAEDIRKFFYSRISNWVTTLCSFPEQYSGGPDKLEPRVRKDFKDTAAWFPNLVTDAEGKAVVKFKLPDNLTTWRATVRGITAGCDVGASIAKVISTQDIIARLALPRFFAQGDQGLVTAVVHNYTKKPQTVKINLTMGSNLKTTLPLAQTLTIEPDGAKRFSWNVEAVTIGETTIKLTAIGQTAADALERTVSVKPMGIAVSLVRAGMMTKDDIERAIEVPEAVDAAPGTIKRSFGVAGSTIGPVLGNFSALIDYPYGCTEQTMSRLVPSIVAMQLNKQLSVPLSASDKKRFDTVYKEAMQKLSSYQHGDGGWGWWQSDESRPYLTAYVMEGMKLLSEAGYAVDAAAMERACKWTDNSLKEMLKQLKDPKRLKDAYEDRARLVDMSYMLYARSLYKDKAAGQEANTQALLKEAFGYLREPEQFQTMPVEAIAYYARAANNLGQREHATSALNRLMEIANTTEATIDWEYSKRLAAFIGDKEQSYYPYRFTPEESTALAMTALVEVRPELSGQIELVKNWLLLTRGKEGWGTTKATAAVFKALLLEELKARAADRAASLSPEVLDGFKCLVNGISLSDSNRYGPEKLLNLPSTKEASKVTLRNDGSRLYYCNQTSYFKNLVGKSQTGVDNLPQDLKMERKFYRLKPLANTADGTIHLKAEPIAGGQIKAGETILMKVLVETPRSLPYVIVEAVLPSGAEVVENAAKEDAVEEENHVQGDWEVPWWTHQDILDDKIVFFGSHLKSGKSEFSTLLRMELPGKVNVAPVNMEGMYTRAIKGLSNLDQLTISE